MTRPCIGDVPEELLEHILRQVKGTASSIEFWNCLRTCRQWHRISLGLYKGLGFAASATIESDTRRCNVHEEGTLSDIHLRTDFDFKPPSHLYLSMMRSLTVHVRHQRIATPFAPSQAGDLVRSLQEVFSSTKRLSTFSLKFSEGWDFPILDVPAIRQSIIAKLVAMLPDTVIHLELDTSGTDVPPSTELIMNNQEDHLCYQISKILTRLRYLRLRVGHICNDLLAFRPGTVRCYDAESCEYCTTNERATCSLLRSWQMRSMTIWLPWGHAAANNAFIRASKALLDPCLRNPTIILLVHQTDNEHPRRLSITEPPDNIHMSCAWTPQSNVSTALRERLEFFKFKTVRGSSYVPTSTTTFKRSTRRQMMSSRTCIEHDKLLCAPMREFNISYSVGPGSEPGTTSTWTYMAEQTVENMVSWTQNSHLGNRFPMPESDECGKLFWTGEKLWPCRFPGCKEKCETLVHLRGHHMYAHPVRLFGFKWNGYVPCAAVGCDRIGEDGFKDSEELEEHMLGHHLQPCTLLEDTTGSSICEP
ncbi:uncharacterized protein K460DRAFT_365261 [Cucurbitaria berberidis CBS 394.84]|uniref:F-box domain-containing protein n=1 Tax=Cucurbitaria berberidis CBS 394.84 TaxID=1168544 RepID=A0A9P4GMX1_9PLEO|nr:uncharacterized protein K460DRAFT_365261 [Cucurbitaria berberidis CBS 394.84]KAF1849378.1 hypothetical protein K460DRAFT_365261 [Cucurbitaria berberidis CBS 394.84]